MKQIFIFTCLMALLPVFSIAQTIQTKTVNLGDDVVETYSYYLDEQGNEVLHGKYSITEKQNYNIQKGIKTMTCTYINGKMNGSLTYSCNMSFYQPSYDGWKKGREQKENFTVNMYEDYLNGDININFDGKIHHSQLTLIGKADKGVLIDGSTMVFKENGKILDSYQNMQANSDSARVNEYIYQNSGGEFVYYVNGVELDFGVTYGKSFILKYPLYVGKPYMRLTETTEYQRLLNRECKTLSDSISELEFLLYKTKPWQGKITNDISPQDVAYIQQMYDSLITIQQQRELQIQQQRQVRIKKYEELFPKVEMCYKFCHESYNSYNPFYGLTECTLYYKNEGKIVPVILDENIENIVCNEINKQKTTLILDGAKINLQLYNHYTVYNNKKYINEKTNVPQYELDTLKNYLKKVNPEKLDTLKLLRSNALSIISKCKQVALLYTKTSSSESNYQNYSRSNCSYKIIKKPIIYKAYLEIIKYIYNCDKNNTLTDLYNANMLLDKINDKMIQYSMEKTKDLEDVLNSATTSEDKLKIFLQN